MATKIGFKVVTSELKSVCNTFKNKYLKNMSVQYVVGDTTRPKVKGSQLFLFDNPDDAFAFSQTQARYNLEVYVAEYVPDNGKLKLFSTLEKTFAKFISVFSRIASKQKYADLVDKSKKVAPKGTVAAKTVKLLYRLEA